MSVFIDSLSVLSSIGPSSDDVFFVDSFAFSSTSYVGSLALSLDLICSYFLFDTSLR